MRTHLYRRFEAFSFFACFLGLTGCADDARPVGAEPLRERFPEHAARVLDDGLDFNVANDQFSLVMPPELPRFTLSSHLPRVASEPVEFTLPDGFGARVRERGLQGEASLVDGAISYARSDGISYWTTSKDAGYEEWIHLNAGVATNDRAAVVWDVEGAQLRQTEEGVEVLNALNEVRLVVRAPVAYTTSGKTIVPRLEVSGGSLSLFVDAEGEEVLVDPVWTMGPNLMAQRQTHTATLLPNGKVLIAGGGQFSGMASFATCDLYDATTNLITSAAPMATGRQYHTATLLNDGRVFVAGGMNNGATIATAALYDPATNAWTSASNMATGRHFHVAVKLGDGRVFVAGGSAGAIASAPLSSVEIYNPATNTWSAGPAMSTARYYPAAALLQNGKVLVTGGRSTSSGGTQTSSILYDPVANTWSPTGSMAIQRFFMPALLLGDGRALILGGYSDTTDQMSAEVYDPTTGTWSMTGSPTTGGGGVAVTMLGDGRVLAAGGMNSGNTIATIFQPMTNQWTATNSMLVSRSYHTLTTLPNNKVLAAGGYNGSYLNTTEIYTPDPFANGAACTVATQCASGFCVDGVCCNNACAGGACDACSTAAGAPTNGTCALLTGPSCNDGNPCTQADSCQTGVCVGANPVTCVASDQCHDAGMCDPM
ncbi:MAG TPA: kelch repeat-containing protein, partial [Polyangium sp.]|nr:kelch repeat-containing protein [Polyangium sp.]